MRKMKKFVAVGLSAMMLAGTFVACGEKEEIKLNTMPNTTKQQQHIPKENIINDEITIAIMIFFSFLYKAGTTNAQI